MSEPRFAIDPNGIDRPQCQHPVISRNGALRSCQRRAVYLALTETRSAGIGGPSSRVKLSESRAYCGQHRFGRLAPVFARFVRISS